MARPTEPGYYWLNEREDWGIVKVEEQDGVPIDNWAVLHPGWEDYTFVGHYGPDQWGGRITQEPVTDPPLPF